MRVVVTPEEDLSNHVNDWNYELCLVVPDFKVKEPVRNIAYVVKRVEDHIAWYIKTRNEPFAKRHPALIAYELRCLRSKPLKNFDHSTIVWG